MLKADNIVSHRQYQVAILLSWLMILLLIARYFQIQIIEHEIYRLKSNTNRIRKVTKNAPRGLILDRSGEILVDNYPVYVLTAIPGEMDDKKNQFNLIAKYIESDSSIIHSNYNKYFRGRFVPTRLAKDIGFSQLSNLEENKLNLSGVYYDQIPERYYPNKVRAAHLFGYVKEVDRLIRRDIRNKELYELGDLVGWSGLEKQYESYLMGKRGTYFFEVDASGREVGPASELVDTRPDPGNNIQTTIDHNLQLFIEKLMDNRKGVILIGKPETGGILAATSSPDYSPDLFTGLMTESEWKNIKDDPNTPLINRYIQGTYIPGSIIKMITQIAILKEKNYDLNMTHYCPGFYQFGDRIYGCWVTDGHGNVNIIQAMSMSCDVFFYKAVQLIDIDKLHNTFKQFGFGKKTKIDIPNELAGLVPNKAYMYQRYGKYGWSKGSLLNLAIGQGELLVTPIQVLNYINLISTRGNSPNCHFVIVDNLPENSNPQLEEIIWKQVFEGMRSAIADKKGTGRRSDPKIDGLIIYGKTGTAENPHGDNHAWYVGWAEYLNEKYSIVVLLENAGSGGAVAAPLARKVFTEIINNNLFTS
ncbi:MAG: penicillin-binding protein 2 [Candidatus Neomarinimicrobiota bacterium]|nr:penicillin-binding protein 2 [Candidatus Neomarinimicrobiota bacterium]